MCCIVLLCCSNIILGVYEKPFSEFPFHMDIQVTITAILHMAIRQTLPEMDIETGRPIWTGRPRKRGTAEFAVAVSMYC